MGKKRKVLYLCLGKEQPVEWVVVFLDVCWPLKRFYR